MQAPSSGAETLEGVFKVRLGASFTSPEAAAPLCTMRYDFKPASIDNRKEAAIGIDSSSQVSVTYGNKLNPTEPVTYKGTLVDCAPEECVLLFDEATRTFVLERLTSTVGSLRNVRVSSLAPSNVVVRRKDLAARRRQQRKQLRQSSTPAGRAKKRRRVGKEVAKESKEDPTPGSAAGAGAGGGGGGGPSTGAGGGGKDAVGPSGGTAAGARAGAAAGSGGGAGASGRQATPSGQQPTTDRPSATGVGTPASGTGQSRVGSGTGSQAANTQPS